jgi:hypothetical protein
MGPRRSLYRAELSLPRYCVCQVSDRTEKVEVAGERELMEMSERERITATHCVRTESALLFV